MKMKLQSGSTLLVAVLLLSPAVASAAPSAALRAEFAKAFEQAQRTSEAQAESAALRGYVLYPYLRAQRLMTALSQRSGATAEAGLDAQIAAFVASQPELAITRDLRRDWLLDLAERQRWDLFELHYVADSSQPALQCSAFQARLQGEITAAERIELAEFWAQAPQMPQACVAPFEWLRAHGELTPERIERRARKALDDGNRELAEWLSKMLPEADGAAIRRWAALLRNPARELDAIAARGGAGIEWDALQAGFAKLAPRDPDHAKRVYIALAKGGHLDAAQLGALRRWVALGLAWDRRADAVAWFKQLPATELDERVLEWRVRSALWNRDFASAATWLEAMPAPMRDESEWQYWRARTLELLGSRQQAAPILAELAQRNGYYSILAAWRLGQTYKPKQRSFVEDLIEQSRLLERPGIQRAHELYLTEQARWAGAEWRAATADLNPDQQLQAARLASHWGWHVQAVTMLNAIDSLDVFEISYPDPFATQIRHSAGEVGLPSEWVYALMRQESLFNPRAVSPSNAYGLLQLLLPTARDVARKRGQSKPQVADLLKPEINVPLGASYLSQMRERFDGQFVPAVAAYNAGPNAVARWLPQQPLDADFWIENVPYDQTRGYVKKVLWHIAAHSWNTREQGQDPAEFLQPVRQPPDKK
jgi:soluble lytic murein transglycosylase